MRSLLFIVEMAVLLPVAMMRPFVGVLLWGYVSFMSPHDLTYGAAEHLPWALMVALATAIGCVVAREPKRLPHDASILLLLAFLVTITISTVFAMAPAAAVDPKYTVILKTFFFLIVIRSLLTDARRIHAMLWVMVIALGFFGLKGGVFAIYTRGFYHVYGPPGSMISDNNNLAVGLLVTLPLMNYLRMRSSHLVVRRGIMVVMALTLFSIVDSYSRGALLGLFGVACVMWWRSRSKVGAAIVLVAALGVAIMFMPPEYLARMDTIIHYQHDASAEGRLTIWKAAIKLALAHPLTGAGFMGPYTQWIVDTVDPSVTARSTHDIFIEVLSENGFPAFFAWLGLIVVGIVNSFRLIRMARGRPELDWVRDLGRMSQVAIVAYLIGGTFLPLSYWDYFFTLMMVLAATREVAQAEVTATRGAQVARGWRPAPAIGPAIGRGIRTARTGFPDRPATH